MTTELEVIYQESLPIIDMLYRSIKDIETFCDIRFFNYKIKDVGLINKEEKISISSATQIGIRIFDSINKYYYLENSLTNLETIINEVKKRTEKEKKRISSKSKKKYFEKASNEKFKEFKKFSNINEREALEQIKQLKDEYSNKFSVNLKSFSCSYSEIEGIKAIINNNGCEIIYSYSESYIRTRAISSKNNSQEVGTQTHGSREGSKFLDFNYCISEAIKTVSELLKAEECKRGKYDVIIDNRMAGVLAHELIGHASEADSIINRDSILKGLINKKIADEKITIVDDNEIGFGQLKYDDEGIKAKKVYIIKNGVLNSYLHSLETSVKLKENPTGNTRCQNPLSMPIVRMRTTYFEPGKTKKDELFDKKECIYFIDMTGGSVNPVTGNFVFKPKKAYLMKNGEIQKVLKNVILSGHILETIKNIEDVANDFELSYGYCGKFGQYVAVGDGGPHIKLKQILIG